MSDYIVTALNEASECLNNFMSDKENITKINQAIDAFTQTFQRQGHILSCGNGGSMCDSMHFAEELTGRFRKNRSPLAAMAVSDPAHISCVANDYGYDQVFSRIVEAWGKEGDCLLAISTSGNSPNVIKATQMAKQKGMKIIALLGKDGGELKNLVDVALIVPHQISDRIQEVHIKMIHIFIEGIERKLFPENYNG